MKVAKTNQPKMNKRQAAAQKEAAASRGVIKLLTSPRTADVKAANNLKYLHLKGVIALPVETQKSVYKTLAAREAFQSQARELAFMRRAGITSFYKFA